MSFTSKYFFAALATYTAAKIAETVVTKHRAAQHQHDPNCIASKSQVARLIAAAKGGERSQFRSIVSEIGCGYSADQLQSMWAAAGGYGRV